MKLEGVGISHRKISKLRMFPKQSIFSRLTRDDGLMNKMSEMREHMIKLKREVPITIMNKITHRCKERLTYKKRDVQSTRKRFSTPTIVPKVNICSIAEQPNCVVFYNLKFFFNAALNRGKYMMLN